ncbi:hypothetical protein D910_05552 [Dendroctonus ponderosae]|uniref:Kinesin-like protein n=1 Tax=Dendroctonus ponderosae TaxID=77166 RepID=U4TU80_DENPD|nr:hypothetical protein D910_00495 [Dendroctonus ponderosae]ERL88164.1 hypothetical protein D910_05552 [Dendroctonus ponderosae]
MPMDSQKEHIQVSVRSRPLLSETSSLQLISKDPPVLLLPERSQTYQFDNVFLEDADQQKVYNDAVRPLVNLVKLGYNCTVFAYGQTGTGKTYTMGSGSQVSHKFALALSWWLRKFTSLSEDVFGKLNLVDLAGSESVKKTGSKGGTFQEGININKGLLCIGQVISALSARSSYIPYRESTITSILKESLNIDNYISLIACVSADPEDITETLQTLDFAQRTKRIRCNPEVVAKFKKDNPERLIQGRTPMSLIQGRTPMKRWKTPLKTPISRSLGMTLLPLINERDSEISHAEVSLSIDLSAKKTAITDVQQMLRITWGKIQDTVTKMVYREVAQLMQKPARAASSPIDDNHNTFPNKILFHRKSAHVAFKNGVKVAQPRNPKELGGETAIRWAEDCRANSDV